MKISKIVFEIEKLKQSIDRHKADLNDVRSKLGKTQSKVDNFCDTCAYRAEKVITSCYRKMQYIMKHSHHLTTEYEAKAAVIEFIKSRFNSSLVAIGGEELFEIDQDLLSELYWMVEAIYGYVRNDFFNTQGTNYTKFQKSITSKDLF